MIEIPWHEMRWEYDGSNNPIYEGRHKTPGASESDTGWYVWRYVWESGNMTHKMGPKIGAWGNRAGLF